MSLERFLAMCQEDTMRLINPGAAARLSYWRNYQTDSERVAFVKRMIRNEHARENGSAIDDADGVSLESIVLDHVPKLFDDDDKEIAAYTLGRVNI